MNDESLERANAFLDAVSSRIEVGDLLTETPAEIGRELGFPDALTTARVMRALISRRRLEASSGSYRLLDSRPLDPGERGTVQKAPRERRRLKGAEPAGGPTYDGLGRAVVERFVELGGENAQLRAELRHAREELREARAGRDDAERHLKSLKERVGTLENRAEMAESNLRSLLATAKGQGKGDEPVGDAEMAAILGVLRNEGDEEPPAVVEVGDAPAAELT